MEHNAANIPELTNYEKERMFSMSERKYNTNNNMNENGEKVRSVESNTRPVWRRYAAIAATFVLLAGGIGGTIALGKHVNNNKRSDNKLAAAAVEITTTAPETTTAAMTTTVTSTTTQVVTDATIAEIVTSAAETTAEVAFDVTETTTVTADDRIISDHRIMPYRRGRISTRNIYGRSTAELLSTKRIQSSSSWLKTLNWLPSKHGR